MTAFLLNVSLIGSEAVHLQPMTLLTLEAPIELPVTRNDGCMRFLVRGTKCATEYLLNSNLRLHKQRTFKVQTDIAGAHENGLPFYLTHAEPKPGLIQRLPEIGIHGRVWYFPKFSIYADSQRVLATASPFDLERPPFVVSSGRALQVSTVPIWFQIQTKNRSALVLGISTSDTNAYEVTSMSLDNYAEGIRQVTLSRLSTYGKLNLRSVHKLSNTFAILSGVVRSAKSEYLALFLLNIKTGDLKLAWKTTSFQWGSGQIANIDSYHLAVQVSADRLQLFKIFARPLISKLSLNRRRD